jgi:hypothetical protein
MARRNGNLRFTDAKEFDKYRRSPGGFVDTYARPEVEVQADALAILEAHPAVAWAKRMNTGAGKLLYPDGKNSRFIRFGFPGLSDIIGQLRAGRFLACECKRKGEKPTDDQNAFLDTVNAAGGLGFWIDEPAQIYEHLPLEGWRA